MPMAKQLTALLAISLVLVGCAKRQLTGDGDPPSINELTQTGIWLQNLGPPPRPLLVAVYDFPDLTGANKPSTSINYAEYSKAVTQGAAGILVDALKKSGGGTWFRVVERTKVDHLLQERKLIQDTYRALKRQPYDIAPLRFAEYIVAGGITAFDTEVLSGGVGASYLGVGGDVNYLKNRVAVHLRLVEVRTGTIVKSVNASKTIYSVALSGSVHKIVSGDLLTVNAAFTRNEPTQFAVQETIDAAVLQLTLEAYQLGLWSAPAPESLDSVLLPVVANEQVEPRASRTVKEIPPPPPPPGPRNPERGGHPTIPGQ